MPRSKTHFIVSALLVVALAACARRFAAAPSGNFQVSAVPPPTATTLIPTRAAQPTTDNSTRAPIPTFDMIGYLVTQAYANTTPEPAATLAPATTESPITAGRAPTTAVATNPVPQSLITSEPIAIPNAINTATCLVSGVGPCSPAMPKGASLFFTWTFGVRGSQPFTWGNAAVSITRDGAPFQWSQVGNGLLPSPKENESATLRVGDHAEFRAGTENIQPGSYAARLVMCTLTPADCNAGKGWQNVGGDVVNFSIVP